MTAAAAAAAAAATAAAAAVAALPAATLAAVLPAAAAPPILDAAAAAGSAFPAAAVARAPRRAQMPGAFFQVEIAGSSSCAVSSTWCADSSLGRRSSRCWGSGVGRAGSLFSRGSRSSRRESWRSRKWELVHRARAGQARDARFGCK